MEYINWKKKNTSVHKALLQFGYKSHFMRTAAVV